MNFHRSHASRRRVATAVSAILATSATFLGAGAPPAQAKINSDIVFTDAIFKHVDPSGTPVTGRQEVWQGDNLEFSVNYDGTNARVAFGDEFTVELPAFLRLQDTAARRPMTTADGTKAGECTLNNTDTNSTISCVFKETIRRKTEVKGSIRVNLQVSETTTTAATEISLSGKTQTIPLPYDKPIGVKPAEPWQPASEPGGRAEQLTSNSKGINWDVTAPGTWLNANHPSGAQVIIKDTTTSGMFSAEAADRAYNRVIEECGDPRNPNTSLSRVVADGVGKSVDGFQLKVDSAGQQETTLAMSGPWSNRCTYHVKLRSVFADNQTVDKATTYVNTASFQGVSTTVTTESRYQETFEGSVSYHEGVRVKPAPGITDAPPSSENA